MNVLNYGDQVFFFAILSLAPAFVPRVTTNQRHSYESAVGLLSIQARSGQPVLPLFWKVKIPESTSLQVSVGDLNMHAETLVNSVLVSLLLIFLSAVEGTLQQSLR